MAATTVTLDDAQLDLVRREVMAQAAEDLRHLADDLEKLAIGSPWPMAPLHDDIHNARSIALESLGTLDALGWPPNAMSADDAAWASIADAVEQALTLPGLSAPCAERLREASDSCHRAAGLPALKREDHLETLEGC